MGIFVVFTVILISLDQVLKHLAVTNLASNGIENIFLNLTYHENTSMIGNISFNWLIAIFSIVLLAIFVVFYINQYTKKVRSPMNLVIFTLIISGGASNLIDRIARGYVVDYVELNYILPGIVFNLADVFIVLGVILLIGMYAITITDGKIQTMNEGEQYGQNNIKRQ